MKWSFLPALVENYGRLPLFITLFLLILAAETLSCNCFQQGLTTHDPLQGSGHRTNRWKDKIMEQKNSKAKSGLNGMIGSKTRQETASQQRGRRQALRPLPLTSSAPPTAPWAIDWGPTQLPEDDTGDVPAEMRHRQQNQQLHHPHYRPHFHNTATPPQDDALGPNERGRGGEREKSGGHGVVTLVTELSEKETEAVDPQFYVTIIISTLLVLIAATITAKLCYDHRGKRRAPLSHSLTLSRTLISEESRQALTSAGAIPRTPSLEPQTPSPLEEKQGVEGSQLSALHRGRIPLVNL
ncbi:PILR alpha-associated neural protein [Erpetoichthys calabaricus]|uniref:PILR alpha-associated neural protein n=1 Tax=Erpetoichthys calabaricus TaxID=27687 RepID=UPI0010A042C2|nr:PILR alpha-associated neural protein [Erpetoichthys calabaricus]